jgi:hypothetical protein
MAAKATTHIVEKRKMEERYREGIEMEERIHNEK